MCPVGAPRRHRRNSFLFIYLSIQPSIHIDYDAYIRDRKRVPSGIGVENTEEKKNGRRVKNCRVEGTAVDEDTRMGARGGRPK